MSSPHTRGRRVKPALLAATALFASVATAGVTAVPALAASSVGGGGGWQSTYQGLTGDTEYGVPIQNDDGESRPDGSYMFDRNLTDADARGNLSIGAATYIADTYSNPNHPVAEWSDAAQMNRDGANILQIAYHDTMSDSNLFPNQNRMTILNQAEAFTAAARTNPLDLQLFSHDIAQSSPTPDGFDIYKAPDTSEAGASYDFTVRVLGPGGQPIPYGVVELEPDSFPIDNYNRDTDANWSAQAMGRSYGDTDTRRYLADANGRVTMTVTDDGTGKYAGYTMRTHNPGECLARYNADTDGVSDVVWPSCAGEGSQISFAVSFPGDSAELRMSKTSNFGDGTRSNPVEVPADSEVTWEYTVKQVSNNADIRLTDEDLIDDQGVQVVIDPATAPAGWVIDPDGSFDEVLKPGQSFTAYGTGTVPAGDYKNCFYVEGTIESLTGGPDGTGHGYLSPGDKSTTDPAWTQNGLHCWYGEGIEEPEPDPEPVAPVAPQVTQPTCENPEAGVSTATTDGIVYSIDGEPAPGGTVTVTATPAEGFELTATDGWTITDGVGTFEVVFDELDCIEPVAPVAPQVTQPTCENPEAGVSTATTDGIVYSIDGEPASGGTVTVTATPAEGFELTATDGWTITDGVGTFEVVFDELDCIEPVAPVAPQVTQPTCENPEAGVSTATTTGIVYSIDGEPTPGGTVTVTATPADGFELTANDGWTITDGVGTFEVVFDELDCIEPVAPVAPQVTQPTCENPEAGVSTATTTGIVYSIDGEPAPGGTVTVTATPADGFELTATDGWTITDGVGTFEVVFDELDCIEPVAPVAPQVTQPTCENPEAGVSTATTTGIVYSIDGEPAPGGTVTVTATPADGFELTATDGWTITDGVGTFEVVFDELDCIEPTPEPEEPTVPEEPVDPAPEPTDPEQPEQPEEPVVDEPVVDEPVVDEPVVDEEPAPVEPAPEQEETIPALGAQVGIAVGIAGLLAAAGVALALVSRRHRRGQQM
ncbi:hypothetical protein GCG21_08695 [Pseudactinotalea sp. HY160]|uniref:InlB B-repeat-containing protein n=1 Tax=Pseudactinotalea sp. HY160 TaxID=2654490 RepID=UPI00128B1B19|nr:hypothetical protein [Pseudactinotalea sp. HY160]MPV50082.1 hypothetical protein [Pseudactinotalea sp. HY160]